MKTRGSSASGDFFPVRALSNGIDGDRFMPNDESRERGELPRHREDERGRQQEAQQDAESNRNTRDDGRGRDAGRTGSESNPR
jgi:hypothetical protein